MKRTISMILALIMALTVISPSVFAAEPKPGPNEDLIFTTTATAYEEDENGQRVILENYSSTEVVSAQSIHEADGIVPLTVGYAEKTKPGVFEGGNVELSLYAKFEYEAGYYVDCISKRGSITKNTYGWIIKSKEVYTRQGPAGTYATATLDVILETTAGYNRSYSVTITCTRAGAIS